MLFLGLHVLSCDRILDKCILATLLSTKTHDAELPRTGSTWRTRRTFENMMSLGETDKPALSLRGCLHQCRSDRAHCKRVIVDSHARTQARTPPPTLTHTHTPARIFSGKLIDIEVYAMLIFSYTTPRHVTLLVTTSDAMFLVIMRTGALSTTKHIRPCYIPTKHLETLTPLHSQLFR